ncbi:lipopolysaccharide biosynthesis protein [Legionella waltersii]|uniref:Polysaccharide biosynthesis protein n=1 Tax=Legionella waltersii TaxID=66969 RepID=A0A0W1AN04_9GAMM|nr:oligosaccharide flippase family protein [Legionella waltersii]KTD82741.1 Polysaccharide biosynthesis protein [Legionella waltersii]SNV01030.1 Polysaccharide biosynthesis protein [Legionella waltersii]
MLNFKKNVSIYVLGNIGVAMIPFFLLPILTRYLSPEEYGNVAIFITLISLLNPIIGFNVHSGLSKRWFDQDVFKISEYLFSCVLILIISTLFVLVLIFCAKNALVQITGIDPFWMYCVVVVAFFAFLIQLRLVIWQVQEKPKPYIIFQFFLGLINFSLSIVLTIFLLKSYQGRLVGYTVTTIIFGLMSYFSLNREFRFSLKINFEYMKDALSFGLPLIPHVIGAMLMLTIDRMIVNYKLGATSAGLYMVAVQIALGFNLLNESFNKAFVPKLFAILKENDFSKKIAIIRMTYYYFGLLLLAPLFSVLLGPSIILFLAGPNYIEAASVLNWLILMQALHGMYYLVTSYLHYECKTYVISIITISCGVVSIFLTFLVIETWGLVGASVGSAFGMLLEFLITWGVAANVHPMPWTSVFRFKKADYKKVEL